MPKISDFNWLKNKVNRLISLPSMGKIEELKRLGEVNDYDSWTILKLIFFTYFVYMYTLIISKQKQKWCNKMCFVDMMAGAGLTKIRSTKDFIIGSPFIALEVPKPSSYFDEAYFFELDENKNEALRQRLNLSENKTTKLNIGKDCNEEINNILKDITYNCHSLIIVDCESGFEIPWTTMGKLLACPPDIIFNFQTANIARAHSPQKWKTLYGDNDYNVSSAEECLNSYISKIKKVRKDALVVSIRIESGKQFWYDLILITKKTSGNSPWIKGVQEAKRRIELNTGVMVSQALDLIFKRQSGLDGFLK